MHEVYTQKKTVLSAKWEYWSFTWRQIYSRFSRGPIQLGLVAGFVGNSDPLRNFISSPQLASNISASLGETWEKTKGPAKYVLSMTIHINKLLVEPDNMVGTELDRFLPVLYHSV